MKTEKIGIGRNVGFIYNERVCEECSHEFEVSACDLTTDGEAMYIDCPECENEHIVHLHQ